MKTIKTNNRTLLFVEVPEDARNFGFRSGHFSYQLPDMEYEAKLVPEVRLKNKGRLTFIATTDTIHLVDKIDILGGGVFHSNSDWDSYFQSFLDKHSITGRHAIIEVICIRHHYKRA